SMPHGMLIAGCPVTLNGQVLRVPSQLLRVISCGVAPLPGKGVAFIGTVGSSKRSWAARTASLARAHAPAQVLCLTVEPPPISIERVAAEDRGDLERVGEFVGALAPAHRALDETRDVK